MPDQAGRVVDHPAGSTHSRTGVCGEATKYVLHGKASNMKFSPGHLNLTHTRQVNTPHCSRISSGDSCESTKPLPGQ